MPNDKLEQLLKEIRSGLSTLYGDTLCAVYLFGSYARGDQDKESDQAILNKTQSSSSRRDFLRQFSLLSGTLLLSPLLKACQQPGIPATDEPGEATLKSGATADLPNTATPTFPTSPGETATSIAPISPAIDITVTPTETLDPGTAPVALVKTSDRAAGAMRAMDLLGLPSFAAKSVLVKPNFNSGDPPPASTDFPLLKAVLNKLKQLGAASLTVGDRSGMGDAARIMEEKGGMALAAEMGFDFLDFHDLGEADWVMVDPPGNHWTVRNSPLGPGFPFARPVYQAEVVVSLCCLKTHRYGGITMSLKNTVGMVAATPPGASFSYMQHLHSGDMDAMIAEINLAYQPALVILDGVEGFISGGPARGELVSPGVILAGVDRVALDALGVAILKMHGSNLPRVSDAFHFRNAIGLGIGIDKPEKIRILTGDEESRQYAEELYDFTYRNWG